MSLPKLAVSLGSFLASVVILEIALRLISPQMLETPKDIYAADAALGFRLIPNLDRQFSEAEWDTHVETNARGFRDRQHAYEKAPDRRRIVGIGDSFLFGFGVESHEGMLTKIESQINADLAQSPSIEAINLGVPGHWVSQYQAVLQEEASRYEPDMVVVFFYMNDFQKQPQMSEYQVSKEGYLLTLEAGGATREEFSFGSLRSVLSPVRVFLKRRSHAYIFARSRLSVLLQKTGLRPIEDADLYEPNPEFEKEYAYTFHVIRDMYRYCQASGTAFLLCIIPEKQQVNLACRQLVMESHGRQEQDYDWQNPQACLARFCKQENIPYLDLVPTFAESETRGESPLYFDYDLHLTKHGHALAAQEVVNYIEAQGILRIPPVIATPKRSFPVLDTESRSVDLQEDLSST